ncbi:MAG: outer membrane protein [Bacteroidetes bacterium]|nr:outer membrane protein [Bacteroidota bacterium]
MRRFIALVVILNLCSYAFSQQDNRKTMNLNECIEYAKEHNLTVKKAKLTYEQSQVGTYEAKQALYPDLSFSSGQDYSYYAEQQKQSLDKASYTGNYGLNSSMTLYKGGRLRKTIQQNIKQEEISKLDIKDAENQITVAIIKYYVEILFANESVNIQDAILKLSEQQLKRSEALMKAGSISKADYAQLESQNVSYKYQLVQAKNSLQKSKLDLKQLLELTDDIEITIPKISDEDVIAPLQSLNDIYKNSYDYFVGITNSKNNIELSKLSRSIAKAGYYPTISLNAGLNTGHSSQSTLNLMNQLKSGFFESVGLNISVPIFSRGQNKSNVKKADISIQQSELELALAEKEAWKIIETLYLDAINNQNSFIAAKAKVSSQEISYQLVEEKFNLGMKNTIELMTERNNLLTAQQEMLQSKFQAIMSKELMLFYQYKPLDLKY